MHFVQSEIERTVTKKIMDELRGTRARSTISAKIACKLRNTRADPFPSNYRITR